LPITGRPCDDPKYVAAGRATPQHWPL